VRLSLRIMNAGLVACMALWASPAFAEVGPQQVLDSMVGQDVGMPVKMFGILTMVTLTPAILVSTTSFLRIIIVFSFLRSALGTSNIPPTQALVGLALFLSAAIMSPVISELYDNGLAPFLDGKLPAKVALERSSAPLKRFMLRHVRDADLALCYELGSNERPDSPDDASFHLVAPAFILSELRTGFEMGFLLFVPFVLLDLIVASVLTALGMVMLPPALISMPLKIMLFALVDGWSLLTGSLARSFT
jgi:flagellar biosynthesis protein FliP